MFRNLLRFLSDNAYLLLTLTALFWAGNFVLGRGVHGHVPPVALAWSRWALASLIVLPFALPHLRRDWDAIWEKPLLMIILAITGVSSFNTITYVALNHTGAISGAIIYAMGPALIALTSFLVFAERLSRLQILGLAIASVGVVVIVVQGDFSALLEFRFGYGELLFLGGTVIWAIYTVYLRKAPPMHWLSFLAATFIIGLVSLTPLFLAEHYSGLQLRFDNTTVLAILYVAIFPSALAYAFYNRGVELIGANRAGVFLYVIPVLSTLLAVILLGERLELHHLIGFALVFGGVLLSARKPKAIASGAAS